MEKFQDVYRICGGIPLYGETEIHGAKNAALPIMAAALCRKGVHELYGCPRIGDSQAMVEILESLGASCLWQEDCLVIDSRNLHGTCVSPELMARLRSSVFLMGSMLARMGEAEIHRPGGCRIGARPIDIHISGLKQLGFSVEEEGEKLICRGRCRGGRICLPFPSVGATENLMLAALSGSGLTVIENCAMEPEIADLQGFLVTCGFRVSGGGTSVIRVMGRENAPSAEPAVRTMYFIMEDRIEAATYMMMVAGTGGRGLLRGARQEHLQAVTEVLERMGAAIKCCGDLMEVKGPARLLSPGLVTTAPFPGFPTDCQPQILTMAAASKGRTVIREEVFESRFTHKKELVKMGANIETCGKSAIIEGMDVLRGNRVQALDLRGGAALVLAGLMAEGSTAVTDIYHIERGYEALPEGIRKLGGKIERESEKKTEETDESAVQAADSAGNCGGLYGTPPFAGV